MSRSKKDEREIAELRRVMNAAVLRMDDCAFECCGDPQCNEDPEFHDLPSKWCDACIAKETREKLRAMLEQKVVA